MVFSIVTWSDRIRVPPSQLRGGVGGSGSPVEEYLERELDATYANRVIPGVGLALSVWSIDSVTEALILAGDGGMLPTGACARGGWVGGVEGGPRGALPSALVRWCSRLACFPPLTPPHSPPHPLPQCASASSSLPRVAATCSSAS